MTAAICTRNRPDKLERALVSLQVQKAIKDAFEIIVVDNAPADDAVKKLVQESFLKVRYICEPRPGLNIARNRALREARGGIVAYLDDDAVADNGWTAAYNKVFEKYHDVALCSGRVEALSIDTPAQRLFEANGGFSRGSHPVHLPRDGQRRLHGRKAPLIAWAVSVGNGCNFAVRKDVVLAIGGFDEFLDRGPDLPGGGDLDMFWRILMAGHSLRYEPRALVHHEHRTTMADVSSQLAGHQRALIVWLMKCLIHARGKTRAVIFLFLLWRLFKPGVRLVRRGLGRDPLTPRILMRLWGHCWLGLLEFPKTKGLMVRQRNLDRLRS